MTGRPFGDVTSVLFDLDGTLVDTTELIISSHEHTLRQHLRSGWQPTRRDILRNVGRSLFETLHDYAVADKAADVAEASEQMLRTYRDYQRANHDDMIRPFEGMSETLGILRERGYTLGVVTSKLEENARLALDMYDLGGYFPLGVFHDDTERHKPDPAPLLLAVRKGGLDAPRTVYVGDSIHDMAAGRAAGMRTVAALWGPFPREDLELEHPEAFAKSPPALLELLPGVRKSGGAS
ncbi:MAG: HAD-IA family hydrolase [Chloroflexota bacterium]|nr:HAD-IA family hydrolase [Chloroflexota bacterium]